MANYKNQKTIELIEFDKIKHDPADKHNRFIQSIDFKYEAAAMRHLTGNGFKVWRYLLRWYGKDTYDFSPAAIIKEAGLGKNGPDTAFDELERLGYLAKVEGTTNRYTFTPVLNIDYQELSKENDF